LLVLCDECATDDWPDLERGDAFAASRTCLQIVVRHAQDTEVDLSTLVPSDPVPPFEVVVRCWVNATPLPNSRIGGSFDIVSGRLALGDAERWDTIELVPGTWAILAKTNPADHPEVVEIWINAAAD
jgi:hypothetical protein